LKKEGGPIAENLIQMFEIDQNEWTQWFVRFSFHGRFICDKCGIGIIIHREYDKHRKSDMIIITNNNYQPVEFLDSDKPTDKNVTQDNQK